MRLRHLVWCVLLGAPSAVSGQTPEEWRVHFAAGEEARRAGNAVTYAEEMAAAVRALDSGVLNRPFIQYHAARAAAMAGRGTDAVMWLRMAWDEGIESLMISFADHDPAFDGVRDGEPYRAVMRLAGELEIVARPIGGAVYLLQGAGANLLVQVGPDGVLLVDTGYGPALPALRRALTALGGSRVDVLLVTHPHEDHVGSAAELGREATVLSHPGAVAEMREPYVFMEGVSLPPKPADALADREVAHDTTFAFNGEEIRVVPTVAHTSGDLSVYFATSRVAHLGDAYIPSEPMMFPGAEDPDGFLNSMDAFLDSMHPETVVVGGHEEPVPLSQVRAQVAVSRACLSFVRGAISRDLAVESAAQEAEGRFPPQWVAFFYRALEATG